MNLRKDHYRVAALKGARLSSPPRGTGRVRSGPWSRATLRSSFPGARTLSPERDRVGAIHAPGGFDLSAC